MNETMLGLIMIMIAAVAGGAFGLQYRIMRKYTVENSSLLSLFFATIIVPLIAIQFLLPGWTDAVAQVGWGTNMLIFAFGFAWGLGAIAYAYGFNILGMALAASLLKGLTVAIGSGVPLIWHWDEINSNARNITIIGLLLLVLGTAIAGKAGGMREKELRNESDDHTEENNGTAIKKATGKIFLWGLIFCLVSGILSAAPNLGYDRADVLEKAMSTLANTDLTWKATLIRWMPMYWGGISALIIFMGGAMIKNGNWKNYLAPGSFRDFCVSSSMGIVHFLAQIPYGIGAYYLGTLGTTVGWGINLGMALCVATSLGFVTGEWKGISKASIRVLLWGIIVMLVAMVILAYANSLA